MNNPSCIPLPINEAAPPGFYKLSSYVKVDAGKVTYEDAAMVACAVKPSAFSISSPALAVFIDGFAVYGLCVWAFFGYRICRKALSS